MSSATSFIVLSFFYWINNTGVVIFIAACKNGIDLTVYFVNNSVHYSIVVIYGIRNFTIFNFLFNIDYIIKKLIADNNKRVQSSQNGSPP